MRVCSNRPMWFPAAVLAACALGAAPPATAELPASESDSVREVEPPVATRNLLRQKVLLVVGAAGTGEFQQMFHEWADAWREAAALGSASFVLIGNGEDTMADRGLLEETLAEESKQHNDLLWIVLIGHGTFDGHEAKFNLRGADVTAQELAEWLKPVESPTVIINCASASAPFINRLSAEDRVIVTATRSGYELNFARFGSFMATAISDQAADLDKDDQISLLEAYLTTCRQVQEYYEQDARLMSEHALLDDNGDGLGTAADWFRGLRATKRAKEGAALDGLRAHQMHLIVSDREARMSREARHERDELEREIEALREKKTTLDEDEYYQRLESLMVQLAKVYQASEAEPRR